MRSADDEKAKSDVNDKFAHAHKRQCISLIVVLFQLYPAVELVNPFNNKHQ